MTNLVTPPNLVTPEAFANAWIGTRFAWDGRDRKGVDCWGLVWCFHRDCLGLELPDWTKGTQNRAWVLRTLAAEHESHWARLASPEPGCIVLSMPSTRPAHVGIFLRGGIMHAEEREGVIWQAMPLFAFAHPSHEFGRYDAAGRHA
jgi:cell wall-associated NlpC family hydrolase